MKILVLVCLFYVQSVDTLLSSKLTVRSKELIQSLFDSWVKFILGWYLLRSFRKNLSFSSSCVQINNISSIYRYHTNGRYSCVLRKSVSNLSMKIQTYLGANLVPIELPDICFLTIT